MKRKLHLFALLAALLIPLWGAAQEDVTVADGTATTEYVPIYGYYADAYVHHQMIYPAWMLDEMVGGEVSHLTWYIATPASGAWNCTATIAVAEVDDTILTSNNYLSPDLTTVWTGTPDGTASTMAIELSEPFTYEGGNLLVDVKITTKGSYKRAYFAGISRSGSSLYGYDYSSLDDISSAYVVNVLPKCTFSYLPSGTDICRKPNNLQVSDIAEEGATFSWTPRGEESEWTVYLDGEEVATVTDTFYTFSDLSPNMSYTVGVSAMCSSDNMSGIASTTFRTPCTMLTQDDLPLYENFDSYASDGAINPCWSRINLYTSGVYNYPSPFSGNDHTTGSGMKLYFYNGSATQNNYLILPPVNDLNGLMLSFWVNTGDPNNFHIQVGTMSNPADATTFTAIYTTPSNITSSTWVEQEVVIPTDITDQYIAIRGQGNASTLGYIDDVTLMVAPSCMHPASVSVSDISTTQATLTINDPSETNNYVVTLKQGTNEVATIEATEIEVELADLTPATAYTVEVYSVCEDGTQTSSVQTSFVTPCVFLTEDDLPVTEGFEGLTTSQTYSQPCWSTLNYYSGSYPYPSTTYHHAGSQSLYFYPGYSYQPQYLISPAFDDVNGLMITFYYLANSYVDMTVGYMTNPTDTSTFVGLYTERGTGISSEWSLIEQPIAAPEGTHYIAIRMRCYTSYGYPAYIDDINIGVMPACMRPASLSVSNVSSSQATLTIVDPTEVGNYVVTLKQGTNVVTTIEATETEVELTGLSASSSYTVEVYSICEDETQTSSISLNFATPCDAITSLPYFCDFESITSGDSPLPNCWQRNTGSSPYVISNSGNAHNSVHFLYLYGSTSYGIMPIIDTDAVNLSTCMLTFWVKTGTSTPISLEIGAMSNPADASTFHLLGSVSCTNNTEHEFYDFLLADYEEGMGPYIVFHNTRTDNIYLDDVTLMVAPACTRPSSISASDITTETATLTLVDPSETGNYVVVVSHVGTTEVDSIESTSTTIALTDLVPGDSYTVEAYSICEDGTQTSSVRTNFVTPCVFLTQADLPITEDYEGLTTSQTYSRPCWNTLNFYTGSYPYPSSSYHHAGSQSLYFYPGYSYQPQYLISPAFDEVDGLMITFYYLANSYVDMTVGYMTNPSDTSTFVGLYTERGTGISSEWAFIEQPIAAPEGTHYIAIRMKCYTSYGYPAYIDDLTIMEMPSCFRPASVSVDNIDDEEVSISWTPSGEESSWIIYLDGEEYATATTPSYTFSGLSASTRYTVGVAAVCDDETVTATTSTNFRTPCGAIAQLPWTEGFESTVDDGTGEGPDCWDVFHISHYPYIVGVSHSGNNAYVYRREMGGSPMVILPIFEEEIENLKISFWARMLETTAYIEAGYVTDASDSSSFVAVASFPLTVGNYVEFSTAFPEGATGRIALRLNATNTSAGGWIDDITVSLNDGSEPQPTICNAPTNLHTTAVSTTTATLDWNSNASEWKISVDNGAEQTVSSHPYTLTDLMPNSNYSVRVKAVCDDGQESSWATVSFTTEADPTQGIDDVASASVSLAPNPATSTVSVSFEGNATVSVLDMSGREVLRTEANNSATLDVSRLARGTYFVRVGSEHYTAVRKLVVK